MSSLSWFGDDTSDERCSAYKYEAIQAAKDLGYGYRTIFKLRNAKSDYEVSVIMSNARVSNFKD